jgi:hypothetical protein
MTTDNQFASFLRSLPREVAEERVAEIEAQHAAVRGLYVPHHHHPTFEAARH